MKKTLITLLVTCILLSACGSGSKNGANYDNDIKALNNRISELESRVAELETTKEIKSSKTSKEDVVLNEINYAVGDTLELSNGDMGMRMTLKNITRGDDLELYRNALYPAYSSLTEFQQRAINDSLNNDLHENDEFIVFEYELENTGSVDLDQSIFTAHNIKQNSVNYFSNSIMNCRIGNKYDYGVDLHQTYKDDPSSYFNGISIGILKSETLRVIALIPKEVKGMSYELSFIVGDNVYIVSGP